jgi:Ca-activated chloride channel family protein
MMPDLSFLAPGRLWLLVVPVVLVAAYAVLQARRQRYAVRFTTLELLDEVAPDRPGWRRHLPAAVLVLGAVAAALAFAKPAVAEVDDARSGIVILAIDTSLSMEATDVEPSRLEAAQAAAKAFLASVPDGVRIGVVGFDGQARTLLAPVDDARAASAAIDRLRLGQGTAIGEAVVTSLAAIDDVLAPAADDSGEASAETAEEEPAEPAAAVVLLSDGETTVGLPNDEAAARARDAGVPVHTIAFGTDEGRVTGPDGQQVPVPVNRSALQELAEQTNGQHFPAATAAELVQVYEQLGRSAVAGEVVHREVGDWFAGASLALLALAGAGSLLWFSRLP